MATNTTLVGQQGTKAPIPRPLGDPRKLADPAHRRRLSGPGLKAFFQIADHWALSIPEQQTLLGAPPRSTLFAWKKGASATLSRDTLERISHVVGIFKDLRILFPNEKTADQWIKMPNDEDLFGRKPVLDFIMSGSINELIVVHDYLDAQRGGWV